MNEAEVIARTRGGPVTQARLQSDLRAVGMLPGMTVLVHSSLSALGWVVGGAQTVVAALEETVGPSGTLLMPAFSDSAPEPSRWRNPPVPEDCWETIRKESPPFDPLVTPCRGLGAIAEIFRTQPGTFRSVHPNDSFTARGPRAGSLLEPHGLDFGCGEGSPISRLYDLDGQILLLGVDHGSNTSLHLAEYRARWPGRDHILEFHGRIVRDGRIEPVTFRNIDSTSDDFAALGDDYERETGRVRVGPVGMATARLMRQRSIVGYAVRWIQNHRRASTE